MNHEDHPLSAEVIGQGAGGLEQGFPVAGGVLKRDEGLSGLEEESEDLIAVRGYGVGLEDFVGFAVGGEGGLQCGEGLRRDRRCGLGRSGRTQQEQGDNAKEGEGRTGSHGKERREGMAG